MFGRQIVGGNETLFQTPRIHHREKETGRELFFAYLVACERRKTPVEERERDVDDEVFLRERWKWWNCNAARGDKRR